MYQAILFDLDGTLTDSGEGITRCVQYALEKIGCPEEDREKLRVFIGPPLLEQFMDYAGVDAETARQAVVYYRERYSPIGIFENSLYPGIHQMLHELKKKGYQLGIASSKPEVYVEQILDHFGIRSYFDVVTGCELNGGRSTKSEVVLEALRRLGYYDKRDQVVLVGDRKYDVQGARECGLECLAVTYGYGSLEELRAEDPLAIVSSAEEITDFFCRTPLKIEHPAYIIWRCLYPILIHFAIAQVIAAGALYLLRGLTNNYESAYMNLLIVLTGITALLFLIPGITLYKTDERNRQLGRMIPKPAGQKLGISRGLTTLLTGAAFSLVGNYILAFLEQFFDPTIYGGDINQAMEGKSAFMLIFWVGILVPIAEEVLFRWLIYLRMRDRLGIRISVFLSAALFAVYHGNLLQGVYTIILGMLFAYLMEMSGSLWTPVLLHIGANSFSVILSVWASHLAEGRGILLFLVCCLLLIAVMILGILSIIREGRTRGYRGV